MSDKIIDPTITELNRLIAQARETKDFTKLKSFCLSPQYQKLGYVRKNYDFITSSKLKAFNECQRAYKYEYIDLVPKPDGLEEADHFVIGQAFDDLKTLGTKEFAERYLIVAKRVLDTANAMVKAKSKLVEAQNSFKINGERKLPSLKAEIEAKEKIRELEKLTGKTQLTETMKVVIDLMDAEFVAQPLFNQEPKKEIFIIEYAGFLLKAELDDYQAGIRINDIKTSRSVIKFDPAMYELQAAFYCWLVEEATGDRLPVRLEVVDKHAIWSRSKPIEYTLPTLLSKRGDIILLLEKMRDAVDTEIWEVTRDQDKLYNSPYYGYQGYGRPTEIIYY